MMKKCESCFKVIKAEFNKPLIMAKKDHDHITTKCWRSMHQECNLKFCLGKNSLLCFIKLEYISSK